MFSAPINSLYFDYPPKEIKLRWSRTFWAGVPCSGKTLNLHVSTTLLAPPSLQLLLTGTIVPPAPWSYCIVLSIHYCLCFKFVCLLKETFLVLFSNLVSSLQSNSINIQQAGQHLSSTLHLQQRHESSLDDRLKASAAPFNETKQFASVAPFNESKQFLSSSVQSSVAPSSDVSSIQKVASAVN